MPATARRSNYVAGKQGAKGIARRPGAVEFGAVGDVALDPTEDFVYFRVGNRELAASHLARLLAFVYRTPAIRNEYLSQLAIGGVDGLPFGALCVAGPDGDGPRAHPDE